MSKFQVWVLGAGHGGTVAAVKFGDKKEIVFHISEPGLSATEIEARLVEGNIMWASDVDRVQPSNLPRFSKSLDRSKVAIEPSVSPPHLAEFLFSLLSPKKTLDAQLGDMQELFEQRVRKFGKARARMLYWSQVLRAIGPAIWRLVRKWGLIGVLIDYGRSKLGL